MSSSPSSLSSSECFSTGEQNWLLDVPCRVEFVLGSTRLSLRDCVGLAPQSIVRLEQAAGADVELRVEGRSIASGEVVIVDNTAGLRVTRILPPPDRRN